jgi:hypothetical protein
MNLRALSVALLFLLLSLNCFGQEIQPNDGDSIARIFQSTFAHLIDQQIEYSIWQEKTEKPDSEPNLFVEIFSNNSFRCVQRQAPAKGNRGNKIRMRQEYLFQANGQHLYGEQAILGDEVNEVRLSRAFLSGKSNWKSESPFAHQLQLLWAGHVVVGPKCIDLKSKKFWKDVQLRQTSSGWLGTTKENSIDISTSKIAGTTVVSQLTVLSRPETSTAKTIEFQVELLYDEKAKLTGWILRDRYHGNPFEPGFVASIESMVEKKAQSSPLVFREISVSNETQVFVMKHPKTRYEYRDGIFYKLTQEKDKLGDQELKPNSK